MLPADCFVVVDVLEALGQQGLAAALRFATTPPVLAEALLAAADVLRLDEVPALAALGERCCRHAARLFAEEARC